MKLIRNYLTQKLQSKMHMYLENLVINQKRIKKIRYRRILINDITFRADLFDLKCQLDVLTIRNKMFVCY